MKKGECRRAATGQPYCRDPKTGRVRFVPVKGFRGLGMPVAAGGGASWMLPGFAGGGKGGKRRGRKMKMGECRRTKHGVKYCRGRNGVKFKKG